MIKYRCRVCAALAYSAARDVCPSGCPACGAELEEIGMAGRPHSEPRVPRPEELMPLYAPMNASVQAVRRTPGPG
jgi:hypothetical protein